MRLLSTQKKKLRHLHTWKSVHIETLWPGISTECTKEWFLGMKSKDLFQLGGQPLIICSSGPSSLRSALVKIAMLTFSSFNVVQWSWMSWNRDTQISGLRLDGLNRKCPSSCQLPPIPFPQQYLPLLIFCSYYPHGFKRFWVYIFCIWKMLLKYAGRLRGISS